MEKNNTINKDEVIKHLFKGTILQRGSFLERFLEIIDNSCMFYRLKKDYKIENKQDVVNRKINLYLNDSYITSQVIGLFNVFLDNDKAVYSLYRAVGDNVKDELNIELLKIREYRNYYIAHNNKALYNIDIKKIQSPIDGKEYKEIAITQEEILDYIRYGREVMLKYLSILLMDNTSCFKYVENKINLMLNSLEIIMNNNK
jgi:hypothetical protein